MGKTMVHPRRVNYDVEHALSLLSGNGFDISEPAAVLSVDNEKTKAMYGPRSPLYGTSYSDEQAFLERTRCKCGKTMGVVHKGEKCPYCNTIVKEIGDNIKMTGWLCFNGHKVISPHYYQLLCNAITKPVFDDIITLNKKVDRDGNIVDIEPDSELYKDAKSIFSGIGLIEFRQRYYEILDYFEARKSTKRKQFDELRKDVRSVFTSYYPIYSTKLRQDSTTEDTFYYGKLDKYINSTINIIRNLENAETIEITFYLQRIQEKINAMWDYNMEILKGKEGIIRGEILGGSLNYTSRNVVIPDYTLKDNEVDLSYHTFIILAKETILKYLMVSEGYTLSKAIKVWRKANIKWSEKVYDIMCMIIDVEEPMILLNRNPTLNYYSMILMKIRKVKKSFNDYTLSIPIAILPGLNADFDGDILNLIMMMNKEIKYMYRKFSPIDRMIMSRDTGFLNPYFSLNKGFKDDLYYFLSIDVDASEFTPDPKVSVGKSRQLPKMI